MIQTLVKDKKKLEDAIAFLTAVISKEAADKYGYTNTEQEDMDWMKVGYLKIRKKRES